MDELEGHNQFTTDELLIKELFQKSAVKPKAELKEQIMQQIDPPKVMEYEPVISQKVWWLLSATFMATITYLLFGFRGGNSGSLIKRLFPKSNFPDVLEWYRTKTDAVEHIAWQLPEIPFPLLASLLVMIVLGIFFIISYQMPFFRSQEQEFFQKRMN